MKASRSIINAAASGVLLMVLAAPSASFASEEVCHHPEHRQMAAEDRGEWVKKQMDKEAAWLEIKASQQGAWDKFAAANIALASTMGERKTSLDADTIPAIRQHAQQAAAISQGLTNLADATEKLQSVLSEDQRRVLDRILSLHAQFRGKRFSEGMKDHEYCHHQPKMSPNASRPKPKAAETAKPGN